MRLLRLSACVLLLIALPCFAATPATAPRAAKPATSFFRGTSLPKWTEPLAAVPPTTRRDPVVVRLAETQAWTGANPAFLVNRAVQVNDKSHLGEIGQYALTYYPAYQKLHLHRVAILRGEQVIDRTAAVNTRLLEREPSLESGFYIGETSVQLLLDDVRVGDTLWITYSVEGKNPVFGSVAADDFSWDYVRPIELRRLTISHPASRPLQWRELGDAKERTIAPVVERVGTVERLRFHGKALEAWEPEPGIPSSYMPYRMIQTSEYTSWQDVAAWATRLFATPQVSPTVIALARQFESEKTDEARASAALHWVQDDIRYFSVALGENSHRPQAPDVVLKRRFGDCKDKSNLLIALLGRLGIKAEAVLVSARAPALPQKLLPSPSWFDHVIVRVHADGKTFFVDPTRESEKGLLSQLPVAMPGAAGLVVADASTALLTLPEEVVGLPLIDSSEKFTVGSLDGDAQLEVQTSFRGNYARFARQLYGPMTASELRTAMLGDYEKQFRGATLAGDPRAADGEDGASFTVFARLSLPKPVTLADHWYSIDHRTNIMDGALAIPDKLARKYPFELPRGAYRARYRMQITWPETVKLVVADDAKSIDNPFFHARKEYSWRGNEVDFLVDFAVKRKQLEPAELPELATQTKLLVPFVESAMKFHDGSQTSAKGQHASVRDSAIANASLEVVEILKMAKAESKAKGEPITAETLCSGILHMTYLRDIFPTMSDAGGFLIRQFDALKGASARKDEDICRARIQFQEGSYQQAAALLTKHGAPKDDAVLTLDLSWARLAAGDVQGARHDVQRFVSAMLKQDKLAVDDSAFAMLILQRSGAALPAQFEAYTRAYPDGPWPRPILAFLSGQLSQEQLLKEAAKFGAAKREMAFNDAWFYIGERRLQEGKIDEARDAFRWFQANGIHGTRIDAIALNELALIENADPDLQNGLAAANKKPSDFKAAKEHYLKAAARGVAAAEMELGFLAENGKLGNADADEAFKWYSLAAQHGDLTAMNNLAILYANGQGVAKDQATSVEWFTRAAAKGHYYASRNLGWRYRFGTSGVQRDPKLAFQHLHTAAQLGNPEAGGMISEMYFNGLGTEKDIALSAYWATRSAEMGDATGMSQYGFMLAYGHGMQQNLPIAIALWRRAAAKEDVGAQVQLGNAYDLGRGVEAEPKLAFGWFSRAAEQGNAYARQKMAIAYLFGSGVGKDAKKARAILDSLVTDGDGAGFRWLGWMAEQGSDGPVDLQKAEKLYRQGAELGDSRCQLNLALSLQFGRAGNTDMAEAATWYRKAGDQGELVAINNLADMHENGIGVTIDLPRAIELYQKAARAGQPTSLFSLGELNKSGKGMPVNNYQAFLYYQLAAKAGASDTAGDLDRLAALLSADQVNRAKAVAAAWHSPEPLPDAATAATIPETAH